MEQNILEVGLVHQMHPVWLLLSAFSSPVLIAILALIIMLRHYFMTDIFDQSVLPVISVSSFIQQAIPVHAG